MRTVILARSPEIRQPFLPRQAGHNTSLERQPTTGLAFFVLFASALYLAWNYYNRSLGPTFQCDFNVYYNFSHYGIRDGWYYKDWLAFIWRLIPSFTVWYILSSVCVLILVYQLLQIKYGWLLVAPCLKIAGWTLGSGNILPILAVLCLTPIGVLISGLVKPHLLGLLVVHAIARYTHGLQSYSGLVAQGCGPALSLHGDCDIPGRYQCLSCGDHATEGSPDRPYCRQCFQDIFKSDQFKFMRHRA